MTDAAVDEAGAGKAAELRDRVAQCLGLGRVELEPVIGGASNLAFTVYDPRRPESPVAFVRCEGSDGGSGGGRYGLRHEAAVISAASRLGFPVAEVLGTIDDPFALVMGHVRGTARPDASTAEAVAAEYMALVAELHRVDPVEFGFDRPSTVGEAIADDFAWWEREARRHGAADAPMVVLGARILRATLPDDARRPCVVHGDIGAGNFMVADTHVSAMLDWELSHVGDPHEDLAWLWMRGAHSDFGNPTDRVREYESAAGVHLDPGHLDWHLAFVMWKSCIATEGFLRGRTPDQATLVQSVVLLTYEALLGAQLVRLLGGAFQLLEGEPESEYALGARLAERVLDTQELSTEARIAVEYLRDAAAQAAWVERERAQDLERANHPAGVPLAARLDHIDGEQLVDLTMALARDADRRARAMPKAVRRVERAQRIGLGTSIRTTGAR